MHKLVVLRFGGGDFEQGFAITLQLGRDGHRPILSTAAELPPAPEIPRHYHHWQTTYCRLGAPLRLDAPTQQHTNHANQDLLAECQQAAQTLQTCLNQWLCTDLFRPIREKLLEQLQPSDHIRVLLQTNDLQLQKLPWHLWELWERYPLTEVALSAPTYTGPPVDPQAKDQVNVLAILGSSEGIDTKADRSLLEQLPAADVHLLVEPDRRTLSDQLWAQPWDILFFAGHSQSENQQGHICLNATETLSLEDLRYALKKAVTRGLKLAIFNSCDGLGLAHTLADLQIPQLIVMREPVPDQVAQVFLQYFLREFSQGQSLYLAVREARERLQGLEHQFPCATWLPVICQNPAELPPTWQDLRYGRVSQPDQGMVAAADPLVTMVFTDLCSSTTVKNHLPGADLTARNRSYFETILQPHRQRVEATLSAYGGRVVKTEGDAFFLVFAHAVQAVQWSMALQQSHIQDPIPTPLGSLQVRIGMHTGSPLSDAEDLIGQEVDYAAHLSDLANGTQILLSEVTAVLLRHAGVMGVTLYAQGEHSLKGIGAVPIFELLWAHKAPQPLRTKPGEPTAGVIAASSPVAQRPHPGTAVQPPPELPGPEDSEGGLWRRFGRSVVVTTVLVSLGIMGMRGLGWMQPLELWSFDRLLRLRPYERPDSRLLVVTVTEEDIQAQGETARRSSLSDPALSQLLTQLKTYQPQVIGLDIYRDFPVSANQPGLAHQLREHDHLIAVCKGRDPQSDPTGIAPPPELASEQLGFSDFIEDSDGVLRRQLLYMTPDPVSRCTAAHAFSSVLAFQYLSHLQMTPQFTLESDLQLGPTVFRRLQPRMGGYQGVDAAGIQIMLNYRSLPAPQDIAPQVTLGQVLKGEVNPETVKNKVVLIGVTANSTGDYWSTPYGASGVDKMPGVLIQAQMVSQLLSAVLDQRPLVWAWPLWAETLWVWGWSMVGGLLAWRWHRFSHLGVALGLALLGLTVGCLLGLLLGGWFPLVPAALALLGTGGKVVYTEGRGRSAQNLSPQRLSRGKV